MAGQGSPKTVNYVDGQWIDGNPAVIGPSSHGFWMSSAVFDGARYYNGVIPDLDLHCARVCQSARLMGLKPILSPVEIAELAWDGVTRFPKEAALYIRPMFFGEDGFILPVASQTRFLMSIFEAPLPEPKGFSACKASFRRPARDMAPTEAKASCLYPNVGRCVAEANAKGFDVAVVLDPSGNVAEFAYTNLFMVKDGVVHTPAINGTFLNGITRQRVIQLLREDGVEVQERAIDFKELLEADELFGTGNYGKVSPCTKLEDHELPVGEITLRARGLYFDWSYG